MLFVRITIYCCYCVGKQFSKNFLVVSYCSCTQRSSCRHNYPGFYLTSITTTKTINDKTQVKPTGLKLHGFTKVFKPGRLGLSKQEQELSHLLKLHHSTFLVRTFASPRRNELLNLVVSPWKNKDIL